MKQPVIISIFTFLTLAGCTAELSPEDRAYISTTRAFTQQAQQDASQSAEEANRAALSAQESSDKSEHLFQQGFGSRM